MPESKETKDKTEQPVEPTATELKAQAFDLALQIEGHQAAINQLQQQRQTIIAQIAESIK